MKETTKVCNDILDILYGNQSIHHKNDERAYPDWKQKCHEIELYCRSKIEAYDKNTKSIKKMKIWWNSNFGHPPFTREVTDVEEAMKILSVLTDYDLYLEDKIVANAGGLEEFEDGEWLEYYDEEGLDIFEIMREREKRK